MIPSIVLFRTYCYNTTNKPFHFPEIEKGREIIGICAVEWP